jgi:hypothetical protein
MRSAQPFLCSFALILVLIVPTLGHAQQWAGIISPSRATDWSAAGVQGGIPNRLTNCVTSACNTLSGGTVTAASINAALSSAPANTVVRIPAGTYTLTSGIVFSQSNLTLRGAGADQTKLIINGTVSGCHLFYNEAVQMCAGGANIGSDSPDNTATWTSGYALGTTNITLSSVTGMVVGTTLFLDQLDDATDGYPAAGDIFVCAVGSTACASQGGGDNFARAGHSQTQVTRVTGISGNIVTISPPINMPNYRSSQSPGAWWGNAGTVLHDSGIENMSIDFTGGGGAGIAEVNVTNTWVRGVGLVFNGGPGSFVFHILIVNGFQVTTQDNYLYGPTVQGNTQYAYTPHVSGSLLAQNNIFDHNVSPMVPNGPVSGSVYAYNFVTGSYYTGSGVILHNAGDAMNLYEGNTMTGFLGDIIHGTHHFGTMFRNHFNGHVNNPPANVNNAVHLETHNRFYNVIGNVMGDSYFNTYETSLASNDKAIYDLGWQGSASGVTVANDSNVLRTLMRWGNYDTVTGTVGFVSLEVPSGIINFSNPVPASLTLPASLYLNSKPAWFGSVPWPAIGPDVTGGSATGYAGHANKIPARVCYEGLANDPSYPSSSPRIKSFNASTCYSSVVSSGPPPPANLNAVVQ